MKPREVPGLPGEGGGKEEREGAGVNSRAARAPGRAGGVAAQPSLQTQLQERRALWAPALPRPAPCRPSEEAKQDPGVYVTPSLHEPGPSPGARGSKHQPHLPQEKAPPTQGRGQGNEGQVGGTLQKKGLPPPSRPALILLFPNWCDNREDSKTWLGTWWGHGDMVASCILPAASPVTSCSRPHPPWPQPGSSSSQPPNSSSQRTPPPSPG